MANLYAFMHLETYEGICDSIRSQYGTSEPIKADSIPGLIQGINPPNSLSYDFDEATLTLVINEEEGTE